MWKRKSWFFRDNETFVSRYCSPLTLRNLGLDPERVDLGDSRLTSLRRVAQMLTRLTGWAIHSTPGWNVGPYPVIVFGTPQVNGRISGCLRAGLCAVDGSLHLWIDGRLREKGEFRQVLSEIEWVQWRSAVPGDETASDLLRTALPVDLDTWEPGGGREVDESHPLPEMQKILQGYLEVFPEEFDEGGPQHPSELDEDHPLHWNAPLGQLLQGISDAHDECPDELQRRVAPYRAADEEPGSTEIYPLLLHRYGRAE